MTFQPIVLTDNQRSLAAAYIHDASRFGMSRSAARTAARGFCSRIGMPEDWLLLTLQAQLALPATSRQVVRWLFATGRIVAPVDYLVAAPMYPGQAAALYHPKRHAEFVTAGTQIGYTRERVRRQWSALALVAALHAVAPDRLDRDQVSSGATALREEAARQGRTSYGESLSTDLFQAQTTLYHLGQVDTLPSKRHSDGSQQRETAWRRVAPELAASLRGYIGQLTTVRRASTMKQVEACLLDFATFLSATAPDVSRVADIQRSDIERYKLRLRRRRSRKTGSALSWSSHYRQLATLRAMFERLVEWGAADVPVRPLIFSGDLPIRDQRLPRFIEDSAAAKLIAAARSDDNIFVRLCVEFLARTGLRRGEFLDLTVDAVVQIGSAYWLRVPLGKLHNDRYIPLHPQMKELLDQWLALRTQGARSQYMFIERGRRMAPGRVDQALSKAAKAAGIGHVTPHQLRHTLATQAINRGMSLEALAALLGHKTLSMTLVYARIANKTVANEYFSVSEKVEALYAKPAQLPADAEGREMTKLRRVMHQRMLGNGYCARPVELDCHFESICESCTYFVTTPEFRPTLERQRADAAAKGQAGRERIFDGLLKRLDVDAS
jgi:integrase